MDMIHKLNAFLDAVASELVHRVKADLNADQTQPAASPEPQAPISELVAKAVRAEMANLSLVETAAIREVVKEELAKLLQDKPEPKRTRQRTPSSKAEPAAQDEALPAVEEIKTEDAPADPTYTMEDCKNALRNVLNTKGRDAAVTQLKRFGVETVTAIPEDQFSSFIAACNQAAGG